MDGILQKLIKLTINKEYDEIKETLQVNTTTTKQKGDVFELYIKELYEGNGWICKRVGGKGDRGADLLLSHPNEPSVIQHIIQTKNHAKPLSFKDTRSELVQFEEVASKEYGCNDYRIISLNGYTNSTTEIEKLDKLKKFNISLYDFDDLKVLINHYDKDKNCTKPILSLYAHNEYAYKKILKDWEDNNSTCIIQATGTGKSKVLLKIAGEHFYNKSKLILAPSNHIINQLKNDKDNWALNNTQFMTYSKLSRLADSEIQKINADLICIDEFHRCGAKTWEHKVNTLLEAAKNNNKDTKILGTTATPVRCDKQRKNMTEELFNGRYSHALSVQEAIIKGVLPMPKYVSALYSIDEEVKTILGKIDSSDKTASEKVKLTNQIKDIEINWEKTYGVVEIIKKHITFNEGKGIVFCENIEHLNEMEEIVRTWFKKAGLNIRTNTVHSKNINSYRELDEFKLSNFKNTIHLLFAVDAINEGVHFGDIKFAMFLRKTSSEIVYLQQLGRVLQTGQKENPLVLDLVCNFKNTNSTSFYNSFIQTLNETNHLRKSLGLGNISTTEDDINRFIFDECIEIRNILSNFSNTLISKWDTYYNTVKDAYITHGPTSSLRHFNHAKDIQEWIYSQRRLKRKNLLSEEKIKKLNDIEFIWNPSDVFWEKNYALLKEYFIANNNTNIPQKYDANPTLGRWVNNQRTLYKKGKLADYKIEKLNKLNFTWDSQEASWNNYIESFINFYKKYGHTNVPQKYPEDPSLGSWVANQRKLNKKGLLSKEKVNQLDSLGFLWDPLEEIWNCYYKTLVEYVNKYGTADVIRSQVEEKFYQWILTQRRFFKKNRLSENKITLLNEIGFVWSKK